MLLVSNVRKITFITWQLSNVDINELIGLYTEKDKNFTELQV